MEPDDFLFEEQDYGYQPAYPPPPAWWRIRARWGSMPTGYRTNVVLYALGAVSLALLLFELTTGDNSPNLEVASRVVPVTSSTSTSRPVPTTSRPSSTTTPKVATSIPVAGKTATTRAGAVTPARQATAPAPSGGSGPAPAAAEPDPTPADPPADSPSTPASTTPTTSPQPPATQPPDTQPPDTQPPDTQPPVTIGQHICDLLAEHGRTYPGC
ncbi:MAG: hypothetical protein QOI99_1454 [Actinomycetota bacterium]|nr:hypothetical protein [Actinomycetota bacterium]